MPSFDIVSEIDLHEVTNAVDQSSREVNQRFDFKGTNAKFELKEAVVTLSAPADFQLKQMLEILKLKLSKRGIDVACMKVDEPVTTGQTAKQVVTLRQGVDTELGKPSLTYWQVLARTAETTRVSLKPVTGRSHQLRVHLQHIGHPIRGDELYAPLPLRAERLLLHAAEISFAHPLSGLTLHFASPVPF